MKFPFKHQKGFSLVEVLVAIVILSIGLMGLAKAYLRVIPAVSQNQNVTTAAAAALSFWATLQQQSGTPSPFSAASPAAAPGYLQAWMQQYSGQLPGLTVKLVDRSQNAPCTGTSCTYALTLSWTDHGATRNQTYVYQTGL